MEEEQKEIETNKVSGTSMETEQNTANLNCDSSKTELSLSETNTGLQNSDATTCGCLTLVVKQEKETSGETELSDPSNDAGKSGENVENDGKVDDSIRTVQDASKCNISQGSNPGENIGNSLIKQENEASDNSVEDSTKVGAAIQLTLTEEMNVNNSVLTSSVNDEVHTCITSAISDNGATNTDAEPNAAIVNSELKAEHEEKIDDRTIAPNGEEHKTMVISTTEAEPCNSVTKSEPNTVQGDIMAEMTNTSEMIAKSEPKDTEENGKEVENFIDKGTDAEVMEVTSDRMVGDTSVTMVEVRNNVPNCLGEKDDDEKCPKDGVSHIEVRNNSKALNSLNIYR